MPAYKDHLHGTLDALILRTLSFGPRHGYAINQWLRDKTGDALEVEKGRRQLRAETKAFAAFVATVSPVLFPA